MQSRRNVSVQVEEDVATLKLGPDFTDAHCLLVSEVAILLDHRKERERETEVSNMFTKTLAYADRFSRHKNRSTVKEIRNLLEQKGLKPYELASLANLCPESVEEAKFLIPSLTQYTADEIQNVLDDITSFKRFD